jgi:hypothetical protein
MSRSSTVAKETLAYCTSCKMDLTHVIVAMQGDRIVRVQCKTCKKEHAYKAAKGVTEPTAKPKKERAKKADPDAGNPIELEWEKLMATHKNAPVKPYSMKGHFGLGDKLNHPSFGDGIVGKLIYPNKLEVIFRHDVKVLIYSGSPG